MRQFHFPKMQLNIILTSQLHFFKWLLSPSEFCKNFLYPPSKLNVQPTITTLISLP